MKIKAFPNGIFGATTYLVYDEISKEGLLIDATSSLNEIKKIVKNEKINIKYILITHGHFDHIYCLNEFKEAFKSALVFIHKDDKELVNMIDVQCSMANIDNIKIPCIDGLVDENSKNIKIGTHKVKILHTSGHSKGGVCFLINNTLFSGDTLFNSSIGRCDLWGGSTKEIERSIKEKLFKLDNEIVVYPGHGDKTTIGYEKQYNQYFGSNFT